VTLETDHADVSEDLRQPEDAPDSLLGCLVIAARYRGIRLTATQLVRDHQLGAVEMTPGQLVRVAEASGLRATITRLRWTDLFKLDKALPAILLLRNGGAMVILRTDSKPEAGATPFIVLQDPNGPLDAPLLLDEARFNTACTGELILVKRDYRLRDENRPFGFGWIMGQLLQDRKVVRDLAICAVIMSFLALAPILVWRLLIDRVMYYGNMNTYAVICVVWVTLVVYEVIFGFMRRHLVAFVTIRTDAKLSTYIYEKVLNLPIEYFERTPTGEVLRDMGEIYKIRMFLAQHIFGTMLDALVIIIFLPIMFYYSVVLTVCVLAICAVICLWIVVMLPAVRRKVGAVAEAEGKKGSFLVESLHGIRSVKSLALDSLHRHQWDVWVAKGAEARFEEARVSNLVQTVVLPLDRMMTTGVFAFAVYLAVSTKDPTYIGALVAFMMLTGRVAQPLIQASHAIVELDDARLSLNHVSNLVNQPPEEGRSGTGIRTPFVGRVEFSNVTFRYSGTNTPALDRVSFTIPEGTVFGLVGRSGSGKTTVTRLLQMLHSNYEGLIKIDGNDVRQIDLNHLRSSLGVVLQENFLFSGSIRETIAAAKPDASFEEIVQAARLAGAEEFIERMPAGYETRIQEGSTNLSGGQRQRLAIARALITNPRILILDEATSALDADSEAIVNANLLRIAEGRTLIIISHRLSSLVAADAILVLERGKVYDIGRHEELLDRCDIYSGLWHQQHRHLLPKVSHEVIPFRPSAAE
jgi:subfamily B ATP-binding cassette protein HlyB/CyaB